MIKTIGKRPFLFLSFLFLVFIILNINSFLDNLWFYVSGSVAAITIKNQWWFALLNIFVFLGLILFIGRKNIDWKTQGVFAAFIISLFVEMYGAPLFLYFVSDTFIGTSQTVFREGLFTLNFLGINLVFDFWMTFGSVVIISGILIIITGWFQLWNSKKQLFTEGFYKFSRHPQYIGFLYLVWGWMIAWPTITTLVLTPILTYAYINAAKKEEKFMLKENKNYSLYQKKTPFLV